MTCPTCGAAKVLRQLSAFAVHGAQAKPSFTSASGGGGGGCCGGGCGCHCTLAAISPRRVVPATPPGAGRTVSR